MNLQLVPAEYNQVPQDAFNNRQPEQTDAPIVMIL